MNLREFSICEKSTPQLKNTKPYTKSFAILAY